MKQLSIKIYCTDRNLSSSLDQRVAGGCMFDIQVEAAWRAHRPANHDLLLDAEGNALTIPI
jgi:hypothetical protein